MRRGLRVCAEQGCPELTTETRCEQHAREKREYYGDRRAAPPGFYQGPLWQTLRREALVRDSYTCRECGARASEVDHVEPLPDGPNELSNLLSLCKPCHSRKTLGELRDSGRLAEGSLPRASAPAGGGQVSERARDVMSKKPRALELLAAGAAPEEVARELGVVVATVVRWSR